MLGNPLIVSDTMVQVASAAVVISGTAGSRNEVTQKEHHRGSALQGCRDASAANSLAPHAFNMLVMASRTIAAMAIRKATDAPLCGIGPRILS